MRKQILFTLIFSYLILSGCDRSNKGDISFEREDIGRVYTLTDPIKIDIDLNDSISYPYTYRILRDNYIVVSQDNKKSFIDLYSINGDFLFHIAPKGRGPEEFTNAYYIIDSEYSKEIYLSDGVYYYIVDMDSTLLKKQIYIKDKFQYTREGQHPINPIAILNENEFISYNLWYDDMGYNKIEPLSKHNRDIRKEKSSQDVIYQYFPGNVNGGNIFINPMSKEIWLADKHVDKITIFDSSLTRIREITGPDHISAQTTLAETPQFSIILFGDNKEYLSYSGFTLTDKHVYIIYQGVIGVDVEELQTMNPLSCEILKFSWDGNPVALYKLDKNARNISVSKDEKHIYITSVDDIEEGAVLYRYNLK